ncbi:MAG TPA: hypothetical protein VN456_04775 [Desulfosporosinus sp.]|nr:hypothetical protein [Desulfosporosinus sp.]
MTKTKEVIVLAFPSRTTLTPLLLTNKNDSMYLHIDPQGCALFSEDSLEPLYRIPEPLLLAQGIMIDPKTVHLVVLKTNGELCYTLISDSGTPQTSLLAKLDVRATRYRRLFLFPKGKQIHIFYAYSNQAIPDLWHIEHRFWDGASWRSVHMGEVVHPREPLYHVNLDSQGNIHLLTMTFQGRHSLLFTNRFNATFHIWGSPTETLRISGEVVDMTALMTSDNVHHLFWSVKTPSGQFELRWAQQTDAIELASTWHPSPAPIKTFSSPCKSIGALEMNGILWLLAHTGEEVLMLNDGKGWKAVSSHISFNRPLQWVHKGEKNFYQTYWLEDQVVKRSPAHYQELGLTIKNQAPLLAAAPYQSIPTQAIPLTPPPVPAFYPEILSPNTNPLPQVSITSPPIEVLETPESSPEEILQPQTLKENVELQSLILTVALLEQDNAELKSLGKTVTLLEEENSKLHSLISSVNHLEEETAELQSLRKTVTLLEQENAKLQSLSSSVALLEQENAKLQSLSSSVALLEQENAKLQSLSSSVALLEQENTKLQSLSSSVALLEQENTKLQSLSSSVALLEQENAKLQSLSTSVALLEQENTKLQSLFTAVTHLEQENSELQSLFTAVDFLEQENSKLQSLISTVARLDHENTTLSFKVHEVLSKFDQILDVISEKDRLTEQEIALLEESREAQTALAPLTELEPFKEAVSNLEQETQSLSQVLRVMLTKQEESDSSIDKLESQICQLKEAKEDVKSKGGFWNKWIT